VSKLKDSNPQDVISRLTAELAEKDKEILLYKEVISLPCPWPESIWTMTQDEYVKAIPDDQLRTAVSGFMARFGWESFRDTIKGALEEGEG
jgi:hypothetical protein